MFGCIKSAKRSSESEYFLWTAPQKLDTPSNSQGAVFLWAETFAKKPFHPTGETQTQVFGYFPPPIAPDFTQIPP